MLYVFESEISNKKYILFALMQVEGIGKTYSTKICKVLGFSSNLKVENLSKEQVNKLVFTIESLDIKLSSDLKKLKVSVIKKLISIKSYRGLRINQGLPVRGQRTHTNSKTASKRR